MEAHIDKALEKGARWLSVTGDDRVKITNIWRTVLSLVA
jgi:hypothetical protein